MKILHNATVGLLMRKMWRRSLGVVRESSVIQPSRYSSRWVAILVPPKADRPASLWAVGDGRKRIEGEHFCHTKPLNPPQQISAGVSRRHDLFLDSVDLERGKKKPWAIFASGDRQRLNGSLVSFGDLTETQTERRAVISSPVEFEHRPWTVCTRHVNSEHQFIMVIGEDFCRPLNSSGARL